MAELAVLGTACNILQLIEQGLKTASLARDIYNNGSTTVELLQEKAISMKLSSIKLSKQYQGLQKRNQTPEEARLLGIAQNCQSAAEKLEKMTNTIGANKASGSTRWASLQAMRLRLNKGKMEDLEKSLDNYKGMLESDILVSMRDTTKTILTYQQDAFAAQSDQIKSFILNLNRGLTRTEDLLKIVEDRLVQESLRAEGTIKSHITVELERQNAKVSTKAQRDRFVESLEYPDMNKRRNNITEPEDATFSRVYRSYDTRARPRQILRLTSESTAPSDTGTNCPIDEHEMPEVDAEWDRFLCWLQSDKSLFWIQGKPGSGKSTLVKYLISHKNTQELLDNWRPGTMILSHFLWKIGSGMQNNLYGLFCSLIMQLLQNSPDNSIFDHGLNAVRGASKKKASSDWSLPELRETLMAVLKSYHCPICIFIDGLDEIASNDGPAKLIKEVKMLDEIENVKLCISGRPEFVFSQRLEHLPTLKLHELTRPDIEDFVFKRLSPFVTSSIHQDVDLERPSISSHLAAKISRELVIMAKGVFLWVHLVTNNITHGIDTWENEGELLFRLRQLPSDLNELYNEMWKRLNKDDEELYREKASLYLNLVIHNERSAPCQRLPELEDNTALPILISAEPSLQEILLPSSEHSIDTDVERLDSLCRKGKAEVLTRCVGFLEFQPLPTKMVRVSERFKNITFVLAHGLELSHRTVLDFLSNTDAGQQILSEHKWSLHNLIMQRKRAYLCFTRVFSWILTGKWRNSHPTSLIVRVTWDDNWDDTFSLASQTEEFTQANDELIQVVEQAYNCGIFYLNRPASFWHQHPFMALVAFYSGGSRYLTGYIISSIEEGGSTLASQVLNNIWGQLLVRGVSLPAPRLIKKLLEVADDGFSSDSYSSYPRCTPSSNTFTSFLVTCWLGLRWLRPGYKAVEMAEIAVHLSQNHPDLSAEVLVSSSITHLTNDAIIRLEPSHQQYHDALSHIYHPLSETYILVRLNLEFILSCLFSEIEQAELKHPTGFQELAARIKSPSFSILHLIHYDYDRQFEFYRSLKQESLTRVARERFPAGLPQFVVNLDAGDGIVKQLFTNKEEQEKVDTDLAISALIDQGLPAYFHGEFKHDDYGDIV